MLLNLLSSLDAFAPPGKASVLPGQGIVSIVNILDLPDEILGKIMSYLKYDEISVIRLVGKKFNSVAMKELNMGFYRVVKYHTGIMKKFKEQLPKRESERQKHPLAHHCEILTALDNHLSLMGMTYVKFIDLNKCCFIPGKLIDEVFRILNSVRNSASLPKPNINLLEFRDVMTMAMEHFEKKIVPHFDIAKGIGPRMKLACFDTLDGIYPIKDVSAAANKSLGEEKVHYSFQMERMGAVCAEKADKKLIDMQDIPFYSKTADEKKKIYNSMKSTFLFCGMEEELLDNLINALKPYNVVQNCKIITKKQKNNFFFVINSGTYEESDECSIIQTYHDEGTFGIISLMHPVLSETTIKSSSKGKIWALDRSIFKKLIAYHDMKNKHICQNILKKALHLNSDIIEYISDCLVLKTLKKDDVIYKKNDKQNGMYCVLKGQVEMVKDVEKSPDEFKMTASIIGPGGYFGEMSLITNSGTRVATAVAKSQCVLMFISKEDYESVICACDTFSIKKVQIDEDTVEEIKSPPPRLVEDVQVVKVDFNEAEIYDFQDTFLLFDSIGDKKISISQLGDVLRALGQNPTEAEVKKCCHQLKPDERIGFDVFLPILQTICKNRFTDTAEDFIEGLRHFDKDGSGFISSAELRHLLKTLGKKLTDDEIDQLFVGQEDSQGNIQYEDFVRMVMSG